MRAKVANDAPYEVKRDILLAELLVRQNCGQIEQVSALERKVLQLALANKDPATVVLARLGAIRELLEQNKPSEAEKALADIARDMPKDAPIATQVALFRTQADMFNAKAQFENSLAAALRGLNLIQGDATAAATRADLMAGIARVYINIDNPAKAIETTQKALAEPGIPARVVGKLQFTEGRALTALDRDAEAVVAFRKALTAAQTGGITSLEANVRGNLADHYLRKPDYVRAEQEARLALPPSQKIADQNMVIMAKANLGFALMGQGRIAAGLPYIDEVSIELKKSGALAYLEAIIDERSRMLEQAGLYKDALTTVREQQLLQRRTSRMARDRAVAALQEEFDATQRTRQIDLLRRENQRQEADLRNRRIIQLATTVAAMLTVLGGFFILVLYRRSARANARLHELNTQLEYHSTRDSLTGLHNRRSFQQKMTYRAEHGKQERREEPADGVDCFALLDIDHFKQINDRWGHGVGDIVLVEVARRLNATVRDTDMVLRWGGEEFLIYAPGVRPAHVAELIKRVLSAVGAAPVDSGNGMVPVTITAGVITLPFSDLIDSGLDWQRGIRLADWALYYGKAHGRNQACIVTHLCAPIETVLQAIDGSKGGQLPDGLLDTECATGPEQQRAAIGSTGMEPKE